jgi:carbon monoxide dehydrogenase subunit G
VTRVELTVPVDVAAPPDAVWRKVTDWERQGDWMLGTRVRTTSGGDGRRLGATLEAVTGIGPLGVTDRMEIVEWTPPRRCVVRHLGRVVRGEGVFEVVPVGSDRARLLWSELLDLPLGRLGALGWRVLRPAFGAGVAHSLRRLARQCEQEQRGRG